MKFWQKHALFISVIIFLYGLLSFIGANFYQDFFFEVKAKYGGEPLDLSKLSEFCGWTGAPYPWESDWDYRVRSTWNMFGALCAMFVFASTVVGLFLGSIFGAFYFTGGFDEK